MPRHMFGSMSCQVHQAHIALCEPMTSIVQQSSSLGWSPTSPSLNLHYKPTFGSLTLCQVLEGGRQRQIKLGRHSCPSPEEKYLFPFPISVKSAISPPVEVENVEFNQSQSLTQYSQPDQSQINHICHLILTDLIGPNHLRANFRASSEITSGLLTTPTWQIPQLRRNQLQLLTSSGLTHFLTHFLDMKAVKELYRKKSGKEDRPRYLFLF